MIREGVPSVSSDELFDDGYSVFREYVLKFPGLEEGGEDGRRNMLGQCREDASANVENLFGISLLCENLRRFETVIEKRRFEAEAIADKGTMTTLYGCDDEKRFSDGDEDSHRCRIPGRQPTDSKLSSVMSTFLRKRGRSCSISISELYGSI
jgi:hypothetical protein